MKAGRLAEGPGGAQTVVRVEEAGPEALNSAGVFPPFGHRLMKTS